nr:sel1 repeat family protein [Candidatus Dependentiae bacterium]
LTALAFKDAPAQYALGQLYYNGRGVDADPQTAFHWYLKSAKQGYNPGMFKAACFLKNGIGILQSSPKALEWFLKVASKDSYLQLGHMYYYGDGTQKDLEKSFYYRKKAAEMGDTDALADMAWMYERGEGTERNSKNALECYTLLANSTHDLNAFYGQARMHDLLGNPQQAFKLYQYINEQSVSREKQVHPDAAYRLAIKHEKGLGTPINHKKALELFTQAAKAGHMLSRLKLRLMERASQNDTTLLSLDTILSIKPEIQVYYVQESKRVMEEVIKNYTITSDRTLAEDDNGNLVWLSDDEQILHIITQDYVDARTVLREVAEERKEDPLLINYEFLTCDPYIKYYFTDVTKDILDEEVSDQALEKLFLEMKNAVQSISSYTPQVIEQLDSLKNKFLHDPKQVHLRKRFLSRYRIWTSETDHNRLSVPLSETNALQYRRGQAALHFSQTSTVCLDGVSIFLEKEEAKDLYGGADAGMPLGARISKVLNHYKEEFLVKHKNTSPQAIEESVEAMRLLKERMRLPLGLPGTFSPMLYPRLGKGNKEIYTPQKVMERFMRGGAIPEREGIVIEPYTPELLVKLLKEAILKDTSPLGKPHLNLFIENNKRLNALCLEALEEFEENDYFDPLPNRGELFKDALFLKILVDHGYIVKA